MKRASIGKEERQSKLAHLMSWVSDQLRIGIVPRVSDVVNHSRENQEYNGLTPGDVKAELRLNDSYLMNSTQQRARQRSKKYRSITVNSLGNLHCDLMFFPLSEHYETPPTYRAGVLVARDILSRHVFAVPLKKTRNANSMVNAFGSLLQQHQRLFEKSHRVVSVSFDKERSVMSERVQKFFASNHIRFHTFAFSSSKAKIAENAIRQIRVTLARLTSGLADKRWWTHLQTAVDAINSRPVVVNGKRLSFAPKDIDAATLPSFLKELHNATPYVYWSQFEIDPRFVDFKFSVGDLVRPKLIVTSSAVLGAKRSTVTLEATAFRIAKQVGYITPRYTVGKGYLCQTADSRKRQEEYFDETDLVHTK